MIRLTLDREGARAEAEELSRRYSAVDAARKKDEDAERERKGKEESAKPKAEKGGGGGGFRLPPLTAPDVLGATPVVGGAARLGSSLVQRFGALASGIAQAAAADLPAPVAKAIAAAVDGVITQTGAAINSLDARLRAFSATFEQVKAVTKAQLLLYGKVDTTGTAAFTQREFTIQSKLLQLQKTAEDAVLRELGRNGQKTMIDALRKTVRTN